MDKMKCWDWVEATFKKDGIVMMRNMATGKIRVAHETIAVVYSGSEGVIYFQHLEETCVQIMSGGKILQGVGYELSKV